MRCRPTATLLVVLFFAACGPKAKEEGAQAPSADSAAAIRLIDSLKAEAKDSAAKQDSIATGDSSVTKAQSAIKTLTKAPATGTIIGRDSAFGPTFTVDSTGKVTPIVPPKKKP